MKSLLFAFFFCFISTISIFAAEGWYTDISPMEITIESSWDNPSVSYAIMTAAGNKCFVFKTNTDLGKQQFALAIAAKTNGTKLKVYASDVLAFYVGGYANWLGNNGWTRLYVQTIGMQN
jgi:hypothetical protein